MRRLMVGSILALLALLLAGCTDVILSPVGTGPEGLIALTLDREGKYSAIVSGGGRLYLTDRRGSFLRWIPSPAETGFLGWPQLTPDGSRLIYLAGEEVKVETLDLFGFTFTYAEIKSWGIHLFDLESEVDERLLESASRIDSLQLSPSGEQLAYAISVEPPLISFFDVEVDCPQTRPYKLFDGFKLYVVPLGKLGTAPQSPPQEVSTGVVAYRWSPGGEGLLLLREVSTQCFEGDAIGFTLAELIEHDLETAKEERLFIVALHPYVALYAALFPRAMLDWNGYEILLVTGPTVIGSTEEGVSFHLYLLTTSGEAFLIASYALYPAFSPTGEKLAFIRGATLLTDIAGGMAGKECRGEIVLVDLYQLEKPKQLAGPGCFSQLFWLSEEELGYVEETKEGAIIWVHELTTGERFNLSATLEHKFGVGAK